MKLEEKDLVEEFSRSGGRGGQNVQKRELKVPTVSPLVPGREWGDFSLRHAPPAPSSPHGLTA